ncbi:VanZ family protein [Streptomyces sp. NPDC003077]|uniref:VanZ family protein n=1 Tax=Streptomyces sp. NPDC003077 TaxID=3154443 RepID=UPI0033A04565
MTHLLVVGSLTLRPRSVPWVPAANLRPMATIRAELARGPWEAAQSLGGAVLLLAPLGVLLPLIAGRLRVSPVASMARTVVAGALVSSLIVLLQTGVPGRVPDVDTVLLNTTGVALAHLLVVPGTRSRLRRREETPQGRTPTITRVGMAPRADALSGSRTYF